MGLLSDLLLLPVTGTVRGLRFIAEQVKEQVDAELDPRRRAEQVQAELIRLSVRCELGQIPEDEYAAQEEALMDMDTVTWSRSLGARRAWHGAPLRLPAGCQPSGG
jgi:hypothetical protein